MSYELNINTSVTGQQQVDQLGSAYDKQTERTKRVAEAVQQYITGNSKLSEQQAKLALDEVKLEQLRERHRMQMERLNAATIQGAAAADQLAAGNTRVASSSMAASSALRVMEGAMPMRAAANFLSTIQGIGPALQMAFPLIGAIALVEVFGRIVGNVEKWYDKYVELRDVQAEIARTAGELAKSTEQSYLNVARMNAETLRKQGRFTEAGQAELGIAASTPINLPELDKEKLKALDTTTGFRSPGTPNARRLQELYRPGLTGSELGGRIEEAQILQRSLRIAALNAGSPAYESYGTGQQIKATQNAVDNLLQFLRQRQAEYTAGGAKIQENTASEIARQQEQDAREAERIARAAAAAARKVEAEARHQATARLSLTRRTDHWMEQQRIEREKMLDREGVEITKESAKTGGEQLKEAMKEAGFDLARYFPHEIAPLTGMETIPEFSGRMSHRERMMAIGSRPGQEGSLAAQQANARLTAINTIRDRELAILDATRDAAKIADIRNKSDLEAAQVRYEFEEKIAELQRRQRADFEHSAVGFLQAGRSGGGAGLAQFMRGQLNTMEDKITGNAAGMAWPTIQKLTSSLHLGKEGSFMGNLLQGTPFGPDPVKSALDANTEATRLNTIAMTGGAAPGAAGGGSATGRGFGAGSPLSLFGKATGLFRRGGTAIEGGDLGLPQASVADMADGGDYGASASADSGAYGASGGGGLSAGARGVGIAGAALAGAYGMYSGIHSGGARGGLTAAGSAVGSITSILAMALPKAMAVAGPVGMAAGLVLGMIPMLMGDPKQMRQQQIASTLQHSQFMAPVSVNTSMGTGGGYSDFDRYGNVRDSSFSPFPTVEQGYFDYRRGVTVGGRTISQFGGGAPVAITINAIDSKSILDRHQDIADAVAKAMDLGSSPAHSEALSRRSA